MGKRPSTILRAAMSGDCGRQWEHLALRFLVMAHPCSSGEKTESKVLSRCSGLRRSSFNTYSRRTRNGKLIVSSFSSDESCVLAGSGHDLYIWDNASGKSLHHLTSPGVIRCLAVSPVYTTVLAGCQDGIRVWNITTGNLEATLRLAAPIHSIAFSPDGAFLLSGGDDAIACLWQWPEQTLVQTFARHTSSITSVAFSSDGKAILTGSIDGTARIWPIVTGDQL